MIKEGNGLGNARKGERLKKIMRLVTTKSGAAEPKKMSSYRRKKGEIPGGKSRGSLKKSSG